MIRQSMEETLNAIFDAEVDAQRKAKRYKRSPERIETHAGPPGIASGFGEDEAVRIGYNQLGRWSAFDSGFRPIWQVNE